MAWDRTLTGAGFLQEVGAVVEPSGPPASLADLLAQAERFIGRFVVFSSRYQRVAVTLWLAHVYAIDAMPAAAYLRVRSAAEESGKTTLLEVVDLLLGDLGVNAVSISPAVVFRLREKVGPVALLLDEVDHTIKNRQDDGARDLLALVNAGYRRSAMVYRSVGQQHEPKAFSAFGPAVVAGIGHLHPTTESRCIPIVLERKPRGEGERWLRFLHEDEGRQIADAFSRWANEETIGRLAAATPEIPQGLRDRHVETWWGLWSIADEAGGEWPELARAAALALHLGQEDTDTMSTGVLLLRHIRQAFDEAGTDRLSTSALLRSLVGNEEGPWGRFWGSEVSHEESPRAAAADLARHLRPFGPKPKTIRVGDETPRGYLRDDFAEAWARYLPPAEPGGDATDKTDATLLASPVASVASVATPLEDRLVDLITSEGPGGAGVLALRLAAPVDKVLSALHRLQGKGIVKAAVSPEGNEETGSGVQIEWTLAKER